MSVERGSAAERVKPFASDHWAGDAPVLADHHLEHDYPSGTSRGVERLSEVQGLILSSREKSGDYYDELRAVYVRMM